MMDTVSELLLSGIARTTLCTTLAALMTLVLIRALGICSTRIHRTVWVLVLLQGWILIPLTFSVSVSSEFQPQPRLSTSVKHSEPLATIQSLIIPQTAELSSWQRYGKATATAAWLLGILAVLSFYVIRYYALITHVPLGSVPESDAWKDEWREVNDAILPKANVHFRVTSRVGPLLCFVPFVYLILVPRFLWASLIRDDRIAIFRHELAHLKNGDLWKNLAIRILAIPQWFNPLVWLAIRRFEEAGEWACDEEVLASTSLVNTGYANTLLRVAGLPANAPCGSVAASGGVLTRRVTRLLSSSDKEVSKMKNLAVPVLLLAITAGQAIRIESVIADEPAKLTAKETRAEAVAKWHAGPYLIEPPDILSIDLTWENFDAVLTFQSESGAKGDFPPNIQISAVKKFHQEGNGTRLTAGEVRLQGEYLVSPDGNVSLDGFVKVYVAGKTFDEVEQDVAEKLFNRFGIPEVVVDVAQNNSKVVYVIEKTNVGDNVCRIPHGGPGHLSLLDALANQSQDFDNIDQVYVVPAGGHTNSPSDRLEVDLDVLRSKNNDTANFELLPGDRIFVLTDAASTENSGSTYVAPPAMVQQGIYEGPAKPDTVMVNVCVAELLPPSQNANNEGSGRDDLEVGKKPSIEEDGAVWLAWAKKHGRLDIISQPEVITLDNQPAFIQVGTMVPTVASKLDTGGLSKDSQLEQTFVGLIVGLTPRISPAGLVNVELDIENAKVHEDGDSGSSIRKTKIQTTVSAKDGQTIVLGGLRHRFEGDNHSLVIAVTPQVNPKR